MATATAPRPPPSRIYHDVECVAGNCHEWLTRDTRREAWDAATAEGWQHDGRHGGWHCPRHGDGEEEAPV